MWRWIDHEGRERFVIWWPTGGYRIAAQSGRDIFQSTERPIDRKFNNRIAAQAELDAYAVEHHWKQIQEDEAHGTVN